MFNQPPIVSKKNFFLDGGWGGTFFDNSKMRRVYVAFEKLEDFFSELKFILKYFLVQEI